MIKGQRVVCVNDTFTPSVRALYQQLPVKGDVYTIREVFLGREKIVKGGDSATVGLLLEELKNPPDPFHQGKEELGFSSERFAPLGELPAEEVEEEARGLVLGYLLGDLALHVEEEVDVLDAKPGHLQQTQRVWYPLLERDVARHNGQA